MKPKTTDVVARLPAKLAEKLMPFQRDGVEFAVSKRGRCLIADEMGLGKTLQAISVAYYYREEWPLLIIVPSSLRYSWIEEFERWLPDINPAQINLIQSGNDASGIATAAVTITTYGLLSKATSTVVREALTSQQFQVVIVDESHYIRNVKTASCKAIVPLIQNANRRILLSGTPALARPVELYPQIEALCPGEFGSWWSFTSRYCDARLVWVGRAKHRRVDGASNLEELQSQLSSKLMIRREKSQVLTQLPPKQRQKVLFELKDSELKKEIRKTFEELKPLMKNKGTEMVEVLTGSGDSEMKDLNSLSLISRLYQLSGEAKIGPAKEYIEMLCDNPKLKFLVFAYHHAMMNGLSQSLYDKKVKFIRIDGETPPSERPQLVHQFQSDTDTRVAILSILAAGVGLTLTAASMVVFAEMYWTPGVMVQCEDRAHRIGQTNCVAVHYLVAKDTMDEWVWSAVCKKTIVTSTTLTGKKCVMEADAGHKYQVDLLSNAEAWIPSQNEDLDLSTYFQSQTPTDQKSILQYFSPSQSAGRVSEVTPARKRTKTGKENILEDSHMSITDSGTQSPPTKRSKLNLEVTPSTKTCLYSADNLTPSGIDTCRSPSPLETAGVILIDSGSDADDFQNKSSANKHSHRKSHRKSKAVKSSQKKSDKIRKSLSGVQACKLETMFSQVSQRQALEKDDSCVGSYATQNVGDINEILIDDSDVSNDVPATDDKCNNTDRPSTCSAKSSAKGEHVSSDGGQDVSQPSSHSDVVCSRTAVTAGDQWSCSQCTFLNHTAIAYCEMCDTPNRSTRANKPKQTEKKVPKNAKRNKSGKESTSTNMEKMSTLLDASTSKSVSNQESVSDAIYDQPGGSVEYDSLSLDSQESLFSSGPSQPCIRDNWERETSPAVSPTSSPPTPQASASSPAKETCSMSSPAHQTCSPNLTQETSVSSPARETSVSSPALETSVSSPARETSVSSPARETSVSSPAGQTSGWFQASDSPRSTASASKHGKFKFKRTKLSSPRLGASTGSPVVSVSPRTAAATAVNSGHRDGMDIELDSSPITTRKGREPIPGTEIGHGNTPRNENMSISEIPKPSSDPKDDTNSNEMTESSLPEKGSSPEQRFVNVDSVPVYNVFRYHCSKYTGRIYLLDQDDVPLNANFVPIDIEVGNHDNLPEVLLHPSNLRLVQRFIREWQSLTETKRRLIIKSGRSFISPLREYEDVRSCKSVNTQRHKTKMDTAAAAVLKAAEVNGSVRVITRDTKGTSQSEDRTGSTGKGVTQALDEDGVPLCLQCFKPYKNSLLQQSTISSDENAWKTRFCSSQCSQQYWMTTSSEYGRDQLYEAEKGICRLCGLDAQSLFKQVRDTKDVQKRADIINKSKLGPLSAKLKEQMVKKPVAGVFWHADHILPVWQGGGQCDIDNLRTLCVLCHHKVTREQAKKRATVRKLGSAVNSGDITAFFQRS